MIIHELFAGKQATMYNALSDLASTANFFLSLIKVIIYHLISLHCIPKTRMTSSLFHLTHTLLVQMHIKMFMQTSLHELIGGKIPYRKKTSTHYVDNDVHLSFFQMVEPGGLR